jgi:glycosyltransferase involved in cell wall biosynthesis
MDPNCTAGLVSVIVPTYNRAHLIEHALDSVLRQTYRPIELIIVDDGSSDGTADVVADWTRRHAGDGLAVLFRRQDNGGAPSARNHGLRLSRGEFIQFLDSDDALAADKLRAQVDALRNEPAAMLAWGGMKSVPDHSMIPTNQTAPKSTPFAPADPVNVPANVARCLFRRQACAAIGPWNEGLARHQDWEYSVRYTQLGAPAVASKEEFLFSVAHPGERIDDVNRDLRRMLVCLRAAVEGAERATAPAPSAATQLRLGRKSSSILLCSLAIDDRDSVRRALSRVRTYLPLKDAGRLKVEALMMATRILGRSYGARVGRQLLRGSNEGERAPRAAPVAAHS